MTIAAAYLTSEGVVLGADSKTTYQTASGDKQLLDHAQKIYEIGEGGTFGLCTFGAGHIGDVSHRTVAALVADSFDGKPATMKMAAKALTNILEAKAKAGAIKHPFLVGYYIGGVEAGRTPCCTRITMSTSKDAGTGAVDYSVSQDPLRIGQSQFDGAPEYLFRLIHGCAPGLQDALLKELRASLEALPGDFDAKFNKAFEKTRATFASGGAADIPLREAIDFVHAHLQMTVKAFKFKIGPPPCGGPVEVAYISTDRPFRWAKHKQFDSAIRENETKHGTD